VIGPVPLSAPWAAVSCWPGRTVPVMVSAPPSAARIGCHAGKIKVVTSPPSAMTRAASSRSKLALQSSLLRTKAILVPSGEKTAFRSPSPGWLKASGVAPSATTAAVAAGAR
jgi:hypothetical protein